ncbi:MAG: hypothetical protein R6V44_14250, partial [Paracoccaceae bacterium]
MSPRVPPRPDPAGDEAAERRSGLAVSSALHLALLAFLILGGPVFDSDDEAQALRLAPVETITAAEFEAMTSSAPEAATESVRAPLPPGGETEAPESPAPPAAAPRHCNIDSPCGQKNPWKRLSWLVQILFTKNRRNLTVVPH